MSETTFSQQGDLIDYIAAADHKAGDIVAVGNLLGQVTVDAATGDLVGVRVKSGAVIMAPLAAGLGALSQGDTLYWDSGNKNFMVTPGVGSNILAEPGGAADSPSGMVAVAINTGYAS